MSDNTFNSSFLSQSMESDPPNNTSPPSSNTNWSNILPKTTSLASFLPQPAEPKLPILPYPWIVLLRLGSLAILFNAHTHTLHQCSIEKDTETDEATVSYVSHGIDVADFMHDFADDSSPDHLLDSEGMHMSAIDAYRTYLAATTQNPSIPAAPTPTHPLLPPPPPSSSVTPLQHKRHKDRRHHLSDPTEDAFFIRTVTPWVRQFLHMHSGGLDAQDVEHSPYLLPRSGRHAARRGSTASTASGPTTTSAASSPSTAPSSLHTAPPVVPRPVLDSAGGFGAVRPDGRATSASSSLAISAGSASRHTRGHSLSHAPYTHASFQTPSLVHAARASLPHTRAVPAPAYPPPTALPSPPTHERTLAHPAHAPRRLSPSLARSADTAAAEPARTRKATTQQLPLLSAPRLPPVSSSSSGSSGLLFEVVHGDGDSDGDRDGDAATFRPSTAGHAGHALHTPSANDAVPLPLLPLALDNGAAFCTAKPPSVAGAETDVDSEAGAAVGARLPVPQYESYASVTEATPELAPVLPPTAAVAAAASYTPAPEPALADDHRASSVAAAQPPALMLPPPITNVAAHTSHPQPVYASAGPHRTPQQHLPHYVHAAHPVELMSPLAEGELETAAAAGEAALGQAWGRVARAVPELCLPLPVALPRSRSRSRGKTHADTLSLLHASFATPYCGGARRSLQHMPHTPHTPGVLGPVLRPTASAGALSRFPAALRPVFSPHYFRVLALLHQRSRQRAHRRQSGTGADTAVPHTHAPSPRALPRSLSHTQTFSLVRHTPLFSGTVSRAATAAVPSAARVYPLVPCSPRTASAADDAEAGLPSAKLLPLPGLYAPALATGPAPLGRAASPSFAPSATTSTPNRTHHQRDAQSSQQLPSPPRPRQTPVDEPFDRSGHSAPGSCSCGCVGCPCAAGLTRQSVFALLELYERERARAREHGARKRKHAAGASPLPPDSRSARRDVAEASLPPSASAAVFAYAQEHPPCAPTPPRSPQGARHPGYRASLRPSSAERASAAPIDDVDDIYLTATRRAQPSHTYLLSPPRNATNAPFAATPAPPPSPVLVPAQSTHSSSAASAVSAPAADRPRTSPAAESKRSTLASMALPIFAARGAVDEPDADADSNSNALHTASIVLTAEEGVGGTSWEILPASPSTLSARAAEARATRASWRRSLEAPRYAPAALPLVEYSGEQRAHGNAWEGMDTGSDAYLLSLESFPLVPASQAVVLRDGGVGGAHGSTALTLVGADVRATAPATWALACAGVAADAPYDALEYAPAITARLHRAGISDATAFGHLLLEGPPPLPALPFLPSDGAMHTHADSEAHVRAPAEPALLMPPPAAAASFVTPNGGYDGTGIYAGSAGVQSLLAPLPYAFLPLPAASRATALPAPVPGERASVHSPPRARSRPRSAATLAPASAPATPARPRGALLPPGGVCENGQQQADDELASAADDVIIVAPAALAEDLAAVEDINLDTGDVPSTTAGLSAAAFNDGYYQRFFRETRLLGRGAFGSVFLATHALEGITLGRYAVKRVPVGRSREWLLRALAEVRAVERLRCDNIIQYYHSWLEMAVCNADVGAMPCLFIVMEYCDQGGLDALAFPKREHLVPVLCCQSSAPTSTNDTSALSTDTTAVPPSVTMAAVAAAYTRRAPAASTPAPAACPTPGAMLPHTHPGLAVPHPREPVLMHSFPLRYALPRARAAFSLPPTPVSPHSRATAPQPIPVYSYPHTSPHPQLPHALAALLAPPPTRKPIAEAGSSPSTAPLVTLRYARAPTVFAPDTADLSVLVSRVRQACLATDVANVSASCWDDVQCVLQSATQPVGPSLAQQPLVSEEVVWRVFVDVCVGLAYLHEHGLAHRDIKLENVMLTSRSATVNQQPVSALGDAPTATPSADGTTTAASEAVSASLTGTDQRVSAWLSGAACSACGACSAVSEDIFAVEPVSSGALCPSCAGQQHKGPSVPAAATPYVPAPVPIFYSSAEWLCEQAVAEVASSSHADLAAASGHAPATPQPLWALSDYNYRAEHALRLTALHAVLDEKAEQQQHQQGEPVAGDAAEVPLGDDGLTERERTLRERLRRRRAIAAAREDAPPLATSASGALPVVGSATTAGAGTGAGSVLDAFVPVDHLHCAVLTDFGGARATHEGGLGNTGTLQYCAPELLNRNIAWAAETGRDPAGLVRYTGAGNAWVQVPMPSLDTAVADSQCDVWALGVLLYVLAFRHMPFAPDAAHDDSHGHYLAMAAAPVHFPVLPHRGRLVCPRSLALQVMVHFLLKPNPRHRPTMREVLGHPVLRMHDFAGKLADAPVTGKSLLVAQHIAAAMRSAPAGQP